jgi:uncharacterized membrane protein YbaN (DUF454 family)
VIKDWTQFKQTAIWHKGRSVLGYFLLVLGLAGIVLPIIPGVPILFAAAAVLGSEHHVIRRVKQYTSRWIKWKTPETTKPNPEMPDA